MRCVVIIGPTLADIKKQISKARGADLLEWRLDLFEPHSIEDLRELRKSLFCPVIFTGMQKEHADLHPDYIDGEPGSLISYHNFAETPADLEGVLHQLQKTPAPIYKIACFANSVLDAWRMLAFSKKHPNVLAISMGEKGVITRFFARPWTYVAIDEEHTSAPGQITLDTPTHKEIYGLLCGRDSMSMSDKTHNRFFREVGITASYIKMELAKEELGQFMQEIRFGDMRGLSVTMPFKEAVLPYLDRLDPEAEKIGAVNTIAICAGKLIGYNTDGIGAISVLEKRGSITGKRVVILGRGGAAKAIGHVARERGAHVSYVGRGEPCPHYDILINATPVSPEVDILPQTLVMDVRSLPYKTSFLLEAEKKKCSLVFGYEMFVVQALKQFQIWRLI